MNREVFILFDGVCTLCNRVVQFVLKNERKPIIKYIPLQSEAGRKILKQNHLSETNYHSFILIEDNILFQRSSAALRLCKYLKGGWRLLYVFIYVPKFIRDGVYNFVSRNRYKWFGKKDQCMVPGPEIINRFIL